MAGSARTVLALVCAGALISLPTLQAAPANQNVAMMAIAPAPKPAVWDAGEQERVVVARDRAPRLVAADAAEASVEQVAEGSADNGKWLFPTPSKLITSPFGYRSDPFNGGSAFHSGVDFGDACGTMVGTTRPGTVTFAGLAGGYGMRVVVDHGGGIWSAYNHLQEFSVQVGDVITQSHGVGRVGSTGRSTGCHLHFEIIVNGGFTDPMPYLTGNPAANPTTYGNGVVVAAPVTTPGTTSPAPSPTTPADPCGISNDPQDAIDNGGLIPVSPDGDLGAGSELCPTPSPSPTSPSPTSPSPSAESPSPETSSAPPSATESGTSAPATSSSAEASAPAQPETSVSSEVPSTPPTSEAPASPAPSEAPQAPVTSEDSPASSLPETSEPPATPEASSDSTPAESSIEPPVA